MRRAMQPSAARLARVSQTAGIQSNSASGDDAVAARQHGNSSDRKRAARRQTAAVLKFAQGRKWREAVAALLGMSGSGERDALGVAVYNIAITACASSKQWTTAIALLEEMPSRMVLPDVVTYNATASACEKGHLWEQVLGLVTQAARQCIEASLITYNTAISACQRGSRIDDALKLLRRMSHARICPDVVTFNSTIAACAGGRCWEQALLLLEELHDERGLVAPDVITYNATISACEKGQQWQHAAVLLAVMQKREIRPNVITYNAVISACEKSRRPGQSLAMLREMDQRSVLPDVISCNAAISACEKGRQWEDSLVLLRDMRRRRISPNLVTYNAAIAACEKGQQPQHALALLERMQSEGVAADMITYSAAISACEKGQEWQEAFAVLHRMQESKAEPDVIMRSAAVSACEKGARWKEALALLRRACDEDLHPDVIMLSAGISACEKGRAWECAVGILQKMQESAVNANRVSYGAAILACAGSSRWQDAFFLLDEMLIMRIQPHVSSYSRMLMECEQRGLQDVEISLLHRLGKSIAGSKDRELLGAAAKYAAVTDRKESELEALHVAAALIPALASGSGSTEHFEERPYGKEVRLLRHILQTASAGDPDSVCRAVEHFGEEVLAGSSWLKVAAGSKAEVLIEAVCSAPRSGPILEVGTYCGYSAIRLANAVPEARVVSLEVDAVHAVIARNVVALAGLSHRVDIWIGHSRDVLTKLAAYYPGASPLAFRAVFMDQCGSRYAEDLDLLESSSLLQTGAVIVADNVLKPGAPLFLWKVTASPAYETDIVRVPEFAMPSEDWMSVTVRKEEFDGSRTTKPLPQPPGLARLIWEADRMRSRATEQARGVTFREWSAFARTMRSRLGALGIKATSSAPDRVKCRPRKKYSDRGPEGEKGL